MKSCTVVADLADLLTKLTATCSVCGYSLPLARLGVTNLVWHNDGIPLGTLRFACPECPGEAVLQVWYGSIYREDAA